MSQESFRGFLLQSNYRIENGKPVLYLYGRLENRQSFLVRESRQQPHFLIRDKDVGHPALRGRRIKSSDYQTFDGHRAAKVIFQTPQDMLSDRDRLHHQQIPTYEADLRFTEAYLIRKNIRGGVEIFGTPEFADPLVDVIFNDPDIRPTAIEFQPTVLSFDIETDPAARELLAISMYGPTTDEVIVVDPKKRKMPERTTAVGSPIDGIQLFVERVRELDPDVLLGWNVIDFDLAVLLRIARRNRTSLCLGRSNADVRTLSARGFFGSSRAVIQGRMVLDGIGLIRGAFIPFSEHNLDSVAREVLGEGKAVIEKVHDRAGEILTRYHEDLEGFVEYSRADARLAYQIVEKLNLISLAVKRSKLTGMSLDRVASSIASFDFVYLSQLEKRKIRAPSMLTNREPYRNRHSGALVLEPNPGYYRNVWTFDYRSLYPSIIRTFNIDPLTLSTDQESKDVIRTTNDACYRREPAILPTFLDELFTERERARAAADQISSQAIKILMNSFYGVLATPHSRFHNPEMANSVTSLGRHFLRFAKSWFEDHGYTVLYGDTDSVFVESDITNAKEASDIGEQLRQEFNCDLTSYIRRTWQLHNKIELELEHLYTKFFLQHMRRSKSGSRKRYVGFDYRTQKIVFVGLESVRRDWTELAKDLQREMFRRLFAEESVDEYLRAYIAKLRTGALDEKLIYRKRLRKPLHEYRKVSPPYVVAGRKLESPTRVVEYVMTTEGPEPVELLTHAPDHEHYLQKQIQPVVQPILEVLGRDFQQIAMKDYEPGDLFKDVEVAQSTKPIEDRC